MYVVLSIEDRVKLNAYPQWCNLGYFRDYRDINGHTERHYHDVAEIWLWHEGRADGVVEDEDVDLRPGVMVYTPAGCQHAYHSHGLHSNTGIMPRIVSERSLGIFMWRKLG